MPKKLDIKGERYGRLVVLREAPTKGAYTRWWVKCDCGKRFVVQTGSLRSGNTKSCGCIIREGNSRTHGEAAKGTPEYRAWLAMLNRVRHSKRRLILSERWYVFERFLADMGRKPSAAHSLDRIDGTKGYSPDNCRWATKQQQAQNVKTNRVVEFNGERKCVTQWAREIGLNPRTLASRLDHGWSVLEALTTPMSPRKKRTTGWVITHGYTKGNVKQPEYGAWVRMRQRCHNPNNKNYVEYGARGIQVCARWRDSFPAFIADMGLKPAACFSLDRINPNGNYEPGNCRWADSRTQQRNRRDTVVLTVNGKTQRLHEWAKDIGVPVDRIRGRLQRGWSAERAVLHG